MIIYEVQLGERYYKVTKGGYHYLLGIEITERRKMITDYSKSEWNGKDTVYNASDVDDLLGR